MTDQNQKPIERPKFDLATQRKIHQEVIRVFQQLQSRYKVTNGELVMLMLASTWGAAKRVGMTTAQLTEWSLKNWGECDQAMRAGQGDLIKP